MSDIERERAAIDRLESAIATIKADLGWYWHWGDGEGGDVLEMLSQAVRDAGYKWPGDTQARASVTKKDVISRSLSRAVMERDAYRCVTCGSHLDLGCDHIIPESKGGPTTLENLQAMCRPCNSRKGNRE